MPMLAKRQVEAKSLLPRRPKRPPSALLIPHQDIRLTTGRLVRPADAAAHACRCALAPLPYKQGSQSTSNTPTGLDGFIPSTPPPHPHHLHHHHHPHPSPHCPLHQHHTGTYSRAHR